MKAKGFAGIILLFALILSVSLLLNANNETRNSPSYKEIIPDAKIILNNYELVLKQAIQDCYLLPGNDQKISCIDNNANTLLMKSNSLNKLQCSKSSPNNYAIKKFYIDIYCSETIENNWKGTIKIDINKRIHIG